MSRVLLEVPLDQLVESPANTRRRFDAARDADLLASVRTHGILTPGIARPIPGTSPQRYELAAGHRRYRAAVAATLASMPVQVRELDDRAFREIMISENLQRQDPDPLDEAKGFRDLIDELGYDVATLAARFGKSTSYVRERLALSGLAPDVADALQLGAIDLGHAIVLARLADHDAQARALRDVLGVRDVSDEITLRDYQLTADDDTQLRALPDARPRTTVTVFELRRRLAGETRPLATAPWRLDDATLVPEAGACTACWKRTGAEAELFPEFADGEDRCRDLVCFGSKRDAWLEQKVEALCAQGSPVLVSLERRGAPKALAGRPVLSRSKWEPATGRTAAKRRRLGIIVHASRWDEQRLGETVDIGLVETAPKAKPRPTSPTPATATSIAPAEQQRRRAVEKAIADATDTALRAIGDAAAARFEGLIEAALVDVLLHDRRPWEFTKHGTVTAFGSSTAAARAASVDATPGVRALAAILVAMDEEALLTPHMTDEAAWPLPDAELASPALLTLGRLAGVDVLAIVREAIAPHAPAIAPAPAASAKTKGKATAGAAA